MKNRRNIFKKLEEAVPNELYPLVKELFNEVKDYYMKMDIYFHFNKNTILFESLYIKNKTYLKMSQDLPLNSKSIAKFVKDTEDFTKSLIVKFRKYNELMKYIEN